MARDRGVSIVSDKSKSSLMATPPQSSSQNTSSLSSNSVERSSSKKLKPRKTFLDKLLHRKNSTTTSNISNISNGSRDSTDDFKRVIESNGKYSLILSESDEENDHDEDEPSVKAPVSSQPTNGYMSDNENSELHDMKPLQMKKMLPHGGLILEDDVEKLLITPKYLKVLRKTINSPKSLRRLFLAQELNTGHTENNEIFVMKFSLDGKYLATAGRDSIINIWKVVSSPLDRLEYEANNSHPHPHMGYPLSPTHSNTSSTSTNGNQASVYAPVFHEQPFRVFKDHTDGVLSLDWSKNNFLISGSMDKTARLWHVDKTSCLKTFKHSDFVTTVNFHPTDDRFFLSGSLDNNLRLWSILDKEIAYQSDTGSLITAAAFAPDGNTCLVGGFNGKCFVYDTKGLDLRGQFEIKSSKHLKSVDTKVTGIQVVSVNDGTGSDQDGAMRSKRPSEMPQFRALITTNDSRIRLLDSSTKRLVTRFKGLTNTSSSIMGTMSDDQKYVISGSENHWVYVWKNDSEGIKQKIDEYLSKMNIDDDKDDCITSKDKKSKNRKLQRKLSLSKKDMIANENKGCSFFHAHHSAVNCAIFAPTATKKLLELSDDPIYDLLKNESVLNQKSIASVASSHPVFGSLKSSKLHELTGKINLIEHTNNTDEERNIKEGFIIVTTDRSGLIRIFRQDSAYYIRKSIVESNNEILKKIVHGAQTNKNSIDLGTPNSINGTVNEKIKRSLMSNTQRSLSPGTFPSPSENYFNFKTRNRSKSLKSNLGDGQVTAPKKLSFLSRNGSFQNLQNSPSKRHELISVPIDHLHSGRQSSVDSTSPSPNSLRTPQMRTYLPTIINNSDESLNFTTPPARKSSIKKFKEKIVPKLSTSSNSKEEAVPDEGRGRSKVNDFEV